MRLYGPDRGLSSNRTLLALLFTFLMAAPIGQSSAKVKTRKDIFPCGYCERDVSWVHSAVCCDACDIWFHRECHSISESTYNNLAEETWRCFKCLTFLQDSFSYHSYEFQPYTWYTPSGTKPSYIRSVTGDSPQRINFRPSAHSTPENS